MPSRPEDTASTSDSTQRLEARSGVAPRTEEPCGPPNESRLSRAAWRIESSFLDHTPRRLQALVRHRATAGLEVDRNASGILRPQEGTDRGIGKGAARWMHRYRGGFWVLEHDVRQHRDARRVRSASVDLLPHCRRYSNLRTCHAPCTRIADSESHDADIRGREAP